MTRLLPVLGLLILVTPAQAQRSIVYDTASGDSPAAISCGFCAGERFGMVFRELSSPTRPGLRASDFPLTVNSVLFAVARTNVEGSSCQSTAGGGTVSMMVEAYAGTTPPTGRILGNPVSGPWAGETMVFGQSADVALSVEEPAGSEMYDVMINTVTVEMDAPVPAPNTYIRVAVTIPDGTGSTTSDSCALLELNPPGAVALRDDDGPVEPEVAFIWVRILWRDTRLS